METTKFRRCWYTKSLESIDVKGKIHVTDDNVDACYCGKEIPETGRWYTSHTYFLGDGYVYDGLAFHRALDTITCKKCHIVLKSRIDEFKQSQHDE